MLQILIGYLFLFFNFEINGIDLLPGFIGYIFIFVGLGKLANESIYFQKAVDVDNEKSMKRTVNRLRSDSAGG